MTIFSDPLTSLTRVQPSNPLLCYTTPLATYHSITMSSVLDNKTFAKLLASLQDRNVDNRLELDRLFAKSRIRKMTLHEVEVLIKVATSSSAAAIRPHYAAFREIVAAIIGGPKRIAAEVTRFKIVERTDRNPLRVEYARSVAHIIKGDETLGSDPEELQIRVQSCTRVARLVLTRYRHELPFLTDDLLPRDAHFEDVWSEAQLTILRAHVESAAVPAKKAEVILDLSGSQDDEFDSNSSDAGQSDYEESTSCAAAAAAPASVARPAHAQKVKKHRQTAGEPMTAAAKVFTPLPSSRTTTTTNKPTSPAATKPGAAAVPVVQNKSKTSPVPATSDVSVPTVFDEPIAELTAILELEKDNFSLEQKRVIVGELNNLKIARERIIKSRTGRYGPFTSSIKSLESAKEHADPATVESIDARIASLKKATEKLAQK